MTSCCENNLLLNQFITTTTPSWRLWDLHPEKLYPNLFWSFEEAIAKVLVVFNPWKAPNKGNIIIHSISQALQNILSRPSKRNPSHDALRYKGRILKSTHGTINWDNHCLHWHSWWNPRRLKFGIILDGYLFFGARYSICYSSIAMGIVVKQYHVWQ